MSFQGANFEGACPSCGATVTFGLANSVVTVCESCGSAVGRGDGKLEDYGKVADLVQTESPLKVGLVGEVKGVPFEITGRTQLRHSSGGVWDEWYVAFRDGERWGWLAEAQGRYYLTFPKKLPQSHSIPNVAELALEDRVMVPGSGALTVVEKGVATAAAAEGEIPFKFVPGETYAYADLEGPGGKFATLDGSEDPPRLYVGGEFPLERLGIAATEAAREEDARTTPTLSVACPQCGGSLDLVAPDATERVGCPYCDSLLDVEQGNLKFLKTLRQDKVKPLIPLGSEGELRGRRYQVIGFLQRRVRYDGQYYYWTEYLLYTPRQPFHWLVHSNGHWTLGQPISAGEVTAGFRTARCRGRTFRVFDRSTPVVSAVYGQFYWKVEYGERVGATDFVSPPYVLSREETIGDSGSAKNGKRGKKQAQEEQAGDVPPVVWTGTPPVINAPQAGGGSHEVNYTLGEYVPTGEVEKAFGVRLPAARGIAPNQPFPYTPIYRYAAILLGIALLIGALVAVSGSRHQVLDQTFTLRPEQKTFFSEPFELNPRRNIRITCSTPTYNSWVYVDGSLYNEREARVRSFTVAVPQDKAGPGRKRVKFLSAPERGRYTLRLDTRWQNDSAAAQDLKIQIHQGVPRLKPFLLLLAGLAAVPLVVVAYQVTFEAQRWQESGSE